MAETEDVHWWFAGRRAIASAMIEGLNLPSQAAIFEIGAGTGGNLSMLMRYGQVRAVEPDGFARAWAIRKTGVQVLNGHLPDGLPFSSERFDLVCLFDVLEHVEEDRASLRAIRQLLKPNGKVLLTVPAYRWLWSTHDNKHHHVRRYSRAGLIKLARATGYRLVKITFFNTFLLPVVIAARVFDRLIRKPDSSGTQIPPRFVNGLLKGVLSLEAALIVRSTLPLGVSLLTILEPNDVV